MSAARVYRPPGSVPLSTIGPGLLAFAEFASARATTTVSYCASHWANWVSWPCCGPPVVKTPFLPTRVCAKPRLRGAPPFLVNQTA